MGPSNIRKNWQQYYESALEELDRVKTEENVFLPKALYSAGGKSWAAIQTTTTNETK
ncbi:MAG TPA: hypothetical protein VFW94_00875 [Candidatus Acidoferrales bacterium]|nr:hypothetical protein [Candidatus Acidoferrales bacterium]